MGKQDAFAPCRRGTDGPTLKASAAIGAEIEHGATLCFEIVRYPVMCAQDC